MAGRTAKKHGSLNHRQIALCHVAAAKLGLDDDDYRELLKMVAGVESSKELTADGFRAVMDEMKRRGFQKDHGTHEFTGFVVRQHHWEKEVGTHRPGMATPAQLARIETDWDFMKWYWTKPDGFGNCTLALRGFLNRVAGTPELRWLNFESAGKVIEALKSINKRRDKGGRHVHSGEDNRQ
ncbi:MAG: regulatory protein GemA [Spirochaetes bacterium]|nr:regulatory protein GemA [Spirochaetota bacterium]